MPAEQERSGGARGEKSVAAIQPGGDALGKGGFRALQQKKGGGGGVEGERWKRMVGSISGGRSETTRGRRATQRRKERNLIK